MAEVSGSGFRKKFKELELIVEDFESKEIDLEKDLPKFEKGLKLASELQKQLKTIENKVVEVEKKFHIEPGDK